MPAFSKPLKRKRQEDDTSNELERLTSEVKEMRELVKSVRSRKQFNPEAFVSRKKRTPSPEGIQKMRDLVRAPTLRVFDEELAKRVTPLYSRAKIIDLTDDTEKMSSYRTLDKALFYK